MANFLRKEDVKNINVRTKKWKLKLKHVKLSASRYIPWNDSNSHQILAAGKRNEPVLKESTVSFRYTIGSNTQNDFITAETEICMPHLR